MKITLLYDVKLRRPACALLQAVAKTDRGSLLRFFDPRTWLTYPTPDMRRVTGTADEWERVAKLHGTV